MRLALLSVLAAAAAASNVVTLTADDFDTSIANGDAWLVKFYAPWCGHCKRLTPAYNTLADGYADTAGVNIAKVDCTSHKAVCQAQGVKGYPTLVYFGAGGGTTKYQGKRDVASLADFMSTKSGEAGNFDPATLAEMAAKRSSASSAWLPVAGAAVVLLIALYMAVSSVVGAKTGPGDAKPDSFSVVLEGTGDATHTDARRSIVTQELVTRPTEDCQTLYDSWRRGVEVGGDTDCLGYRIVGEPRFEWLSYTQADARAEQFGAGCVHLDLFPVVDGMRMLAFYLKNSPDWVVAEQGCFKQGATTVPLYDTLGEESIEYVINQTQLTTVFTSPDKLERLAHVGAHCASLANVVVVGEASEADRAAVEAAGLHLFSMADVEAAGAEHPCDHHPPVPEGVATFCYTSGTTGNPKGVMLTHANMIADIAAVVQAGVDLNSNDRHLSYLPLAHVFERCVEAACYYGGAAVGFYQGDTLKLLDDLAVLQPTVFPSVPRLLVKIYDKIMAGAQASPIKKWMVGTALSVKLEGLRHGHLTHAFWDALVFNGIKKKLGLQHCRMLITGSAPLAAHVMDFLRVCFGTVMEGYGMSETAAAATLSFNTDYTSGHVGGPVPCTEIRLESVPDMEYLVTDTHHGDLPVEGRGEICFRGPNITAGYYKLPDKTAETIDADGWLHSGDIGVWTLDGKLKIVDRKKNIFKLSQGEYVAAEKIENILVKSSLVAQIFVYGDSHQSCLVAIVVPEEETAMAWARSNGVQGGSFAELCARPELNEAILADVKSIGKASKLHGFEIPKKVHLSAELFSVENNILTPTFKLVRNKAKAAFAAQIDEMYHALGGSTAGVRQG